MTKFNPKTTEQPVETIADPLTEMLRQGAKELIAQAVEAELVSMLEQHQGLRMLDGRQAVVRNSYLPERTIQTGLGDVEVIEACSIGLSQQNRAAKYRPINRHKLNQSTLFGSFIATRPRTQLIVQKRRLPAAIWTNLCLTGH